MSPNGAVAPTATTCISPGWSPPPDQGPVAHPGFRHGGRRRRPADRLLDPCDMQCRQRRHQGQTAAIQRQPARPPPRHEQPRRSSGRPGAGRRCRDGGAGAGDIEAHQGPGCAPAHPPTPGTLTIIDESYNASPVSMEASLQVLKASDPSGRPPHRGAGRHAGTGRVAHRCCMPPWPDRCRPTAPTSCSAAVPT